MTPNNEKISRSENPIDYTDSFSCRHIGPRKEQSGEMLRAIGFSEFDNFISAVVPKDIRLSKSLELAPPLSESEVLSRLREMAAKNQVWKSYLGMGYYGTITPPVIQRNILENPGWYTQYTPYQAEISQGRLEALLNFQTMIIDLTGLPVANASLLDEATAAAEAMTVCFGAANRDISRPFWVSKKCHPQTIAVIQTRAEPLGIDVRVVDEQQMDFSKPALGALVQYPATDGSILDYHGLASQVHNSGGLLVVAADLLALCVLTPPAEFGADIIVGSAQRFGVPMGYGGPHAAFMSVKEELKRIIPGRIIGVSQDANGNPAMRLALQTREQHIRREKATSNICTAQVLLAVMASMYAVYHGPKGLRAIARRVSRMAEVFAEGMVQLGAQVGPEVFFDTVLVRLNDSGKVDLVLREAAANRINLRKYSANEITVSFDEATSASDLSRLLKVFGRGLGNENGAGTISSLDSRAKRSIVGSKFERKSEYLKHSVFNRYHSETEMLRYVHRLQAKDLSLTTSMIPLGSCTMKLNATAEMYAVTWPEFGGLHPFAPKDQAQGYQQLFKDLEAKLSEITGFPGMSLQPNAGSQGEYAGLLVIRKYHQSRGDKKRDICLIPKSAHGTNPASAVMAGMKVVVVECDSEGNIDLADLRAKASANKETLSCSMITYPSTHGVFEETIREICKITHENGGQVYMDGANMNAQVALCRPGDFGPDVCHLNLHKTFAIPHGGGGPGMGPIGVAKHLVAFLPSHPVTSPLANKADEKTAIGPVSAAPWGSASVLPISWAYIAMLGEQGLREATEYAILNANYVAKRLDPYFPVLYKGRSGLVAHECIIDLRKFKETAGVEVEDVAKRLMDYGFHAPTMSWPVPGTMMIEPTESESKEELDRFCDAMILIRKEIEEIEKGIADRADNVLKNAPHTSAMICSSDWRHQYSREKAVFPAQWTRTHKYWPPVARVNNVLGDRNLVCACPSIEEYR